MFRKTTAINQFKRRLTRWISKHLMRSLFCLVALYIFSITLPLTLAMSTPAQIGHKANSTQLSMIQLVNMTLPSPIFRQWTHSREEDQGDTLVYRPSDYPFPPARGREGLEFRENGEIIRYQIGPTDRSLTVPGRWRVQETNVVKVQFPNQSNSSYTLTILECNENLLKVRQTTDGE